MNSDQFDGVYIAYFSGEIGTSLGIFTLLGSELTGGDVGGGLYRGTLEINPDEMTAKGEVNFRMNAGGTSITGAYSDFPIDYNTYVELTLPLEEVSYHVINTLTGAVSVRFEKVR